MEMVEMKLLNRLREQIDPSTLWVFYVLIVGVELFYLWTTQSDPTINWMFTAYNGTILNYGLLWTWLNPFFLLATPYKIYFTFFIVGAAAFQYWLWTKKKLPFLVGYLSQIQTLVWIQFWSYQNITPLFFQSLAFWNPFMIGFWFLQKLPFGYSTDFSDSHWQCVFGKQTVLNANGFPVCGPTNFFGPTQLVWHFMELGWIFAPAIYWTLKLRLVQRMKALIW
jgi:hypothetical protein